MVKKQTNGKRRKKERKRDRDGNRAAKKRKKYTIEQVRKWKKVWVIVKNLEIESDNRERNADV